MPLSRSRRRAAEAAAILLLLPALCAPQLVDDHEDPHGRGPRSAIKRASAGAVALSHLEGVLQAAALGPSGLRAGLSPSELASLDDAFTEAKRAGTPSKDLRNQARNAFDKYDRAMSPDAPALSAEAAASLANANPDIFGGIASEQLLGQGRFADARAAADAAIKAGDKSADSYYLRGAAAQRLGDLKQAHEDAAAALSLDPGHEQALALFKLTERKIGEVGELSKEKREEQSLPRQQRAEEDEVVPDSIDKKQFARSRSLVDGARERLRLRDYTGALDLLDKALKLNPEDAQAYYLRADVLMRLGRFDAAERDATRLLEVVPGHTGGLNMRALARNRLKKHEAALKDADEAAKGNSYSGQAHFNRAFALEGLGRRAEAVEALKLATQLDPKFRGSYVRLAGLPADADPMLIFGEAGPGRTQAAAPGNPPGHRLPPGWVWAAVLAGLGLAVYGWTRTRPAMVAASVTTGPRADTPTGPTLPSSQAAQLASGSILGRYRIDREVAQGGMGVVYEAFDEALRRKVAVKRMRPEIRANPRERERFLAEARTVAALRHPNIVEIHSIEDDGRDGFLIFEFVEGVTLDHMLRRGGRLQLAQAKDIFVAVCDALDYAHGHGVIHRDLKPSNIMVDSRRVPKVMDFGVARQSQDALGRLAVTRTVCGTPAYMAPEQEQGRVGRESDLYSLGVCLYELLTERLPFDGTDYSKKLAGDFVPASYLVPGLCPALDDVLAKALEPDPAQRFHSARQFGVALEKV